MKFTSSKVQNDAWLPCMTGKACRKSRTPNNKTKDESESSFIQKALVVEKIRLLWADKHRPRNLNGFTCHREQVQQLKQLVSTEFCPHIIFKGPPGSGKRSLCRAVLTEIFGLSLFEELQWAGIFICAHSCASVIKQSPCGTQHEVSIQER